MTNAPTAMLGTVWTGALGLSLALGMTVVSGRTARAGEAKVPVTLSGGHEIGPDDYGRPVALLAAGLGVKAEVFRKAFGGVTPSRGGPPSAALARRNKAALLKVLGPHGVTNERLDEVSDYYRFRPQRGELWPTTPAEAYAIVKDGKVQRIVVTNPGSGYCTPPRAIIQGLEGLRLEVTLRFGRDLKKNGAIGSIQVASPGTPATRR